MSMRRRLVQILSSILIVTILFSGFSLPSASAQGKDDGLQRQVNAQTGKISFLGPQTGRSLSASRALGTFLRPQDPAMALAKRFAPEFGLKDPARDLRGMKNNRAPDGRITARYQQQYQGVPVMGGELIVNTNDNGDLYSMNGEASPDLSLSVQPTITSEQAKQTALQAVAKWYQKTPEDFLTSEPALWIFDESLLRQSTRPAELVWRMDVTPKDVGVPVRELVLVNAQRGNISLHFNQIDTAWGSLGIASAAQNIQSIPIRETKTNQEASTPSALLGELTALTGATRYVATTGSDGNTCSSSGSPCKTINGAMAKASDGDTIMVAIGTYTGTGTEAVLINKNITLSGGWNSSFTTQSGRSTIDGQAARRGITVNLNISATIENLVVQNGYWDCCEEGGGGIYNLGTLILNNSRITNNAAYYQGGGIYNRGFLTMNNGTVSNNTTVADSNQGGGISNSMYNPGSGILTLNNSTVSGNSAKLGGGISNGQTATINNSTISGNSALGSGGGINNGGQLTINGSTITNNIVLEGSGAGGAGIYHGVGNVTIQNTIIAHNSPSDCTTNPYGAPTIHSNGYNLIGDKSYCTIASTTGDLMGTRANPIKPRLTPLQDNGGPTFTHALLAGSPAIDAGNPVAPGSGGSACLGTDQRGVSRPVGTRCDVGSYEGTVLSPTSPYVSTYTAYDNSAQSLPGNFLCNEVDPDCTNGDEQAKAAHKYALGIYSLYVTQFNRDSLDNHGMVIKSTVHYCDPYVACPYDNANWNGEQIVYGDGSGWPLADDVVAHEYTHGVTQYESNLFYYYQSGAINESFSDVFGEYYDQTNGLGTDTVGVKWLVSEDILPSAAGAIRSMSNPPAFLDPDKMSSPNYYFGEGDSGGVHHNSGINNKAAFLMVDGGSFNGKTVTALGWTKTGAIYYEANINLLTSGGDYSDLYYALQQACSNLIGQKGITSADCAEVKDALDAVEMNAQPAPNFNSDAPVCAAGSLPNISFADDLEAGTGKWTFNNGAYPRWQSDNPYVSYAQSGLHSLYADDYPDVVTDATAILIPLAIPSNAYLRFAQAYDFEKDAGIFYDGGVLEYSLNNGATWIDAGSLIDFNGYKGKLFTGAKNPLSGRSAFVGISHGYISTRLNLASLAGKTVIFRWRMGLDEAGSSLGWWVDNVKLYQCNPLPATFNKTSPANGASGVSLSTTLSWNASTYATSYQYCYDLIDDNQCNRTWMGPVTGTSADISNLGANATYYWQVRAVNAVGTTYANNQTWSSFTTTSTLPAGTAEIETWAGTEVQGKYSLGQGQSLRDSYPGLNNGPVKIVSTNNVPLISAERVIYKVKNVNTSFTELMGLPDKQLDSSYWLPWYNNVDLDTQLRFGNVDPLQTATVHVKVGGVEVTGCIPHDSPFTLQPGESERVSCAGLNDGPVELLSEGNVLIVAAERVIYKVGGVNTSFSEMRALPNSQLDDTYWLPWYNNVDLDTQLRIGNVDPNLEATVHLFIGGQEMTTQCLPNGPVMLQPGESARVSCTGLNAGPVQIRSDNNVPIVAAERLIYKVNGTKTSFSEMMGLPDKQLDSSYWLPWYNNADLDTQLRFGNVDPLQTATVHVLVNGAEVSNCTPHASPFTLQPGESARVSCTGLNNGPVQILSEGSVPIVAAERVIYKVNKINTSFSEMMALPDSQLDSTYWLPWYNNVDLDTQLRFGVP